MKDRLKLAGIVIGLAAIFVFLGYATFDEWSTLAGALLGSP